MPPLEAEAVELFIARAGDARPDIALSEANLETVAQICALLDGLPLAIELAATRLRYLSPKALLGRIDDRLTLLAGGARDLPDRQRTLRDAIAWSHDLLSPEEQTLFRRLAVFAGGFTLDAAEAHRPLPPFVFDGVASLLDKSLLIRSEEADGDPRYGMLETIRHFGLERLAANGEADDVRRRHALGVWTWPSRPLPSLVARSTRAGYAGSTGNIPTSGRPWASPRSGAIPPLGTSSWRHFGDFGMRKGIWRKAAPGRSACSTLGTGTKRSPGRPRWEPPRWWTFARATTRTRWTWPRKGWRSPAG